MTSPASQPNLPGVTVEVHAPTVDLNGARSILRCHEAEVLAAIEDKRNGIAWAWNIASRRADRREVRILVRALEDYQAGRKCQMVEREVMMTLFPTRNGKAFVDGPDFKLALTCSDDLITKLIDERSLPQLPGTHYRRGRNGAAVIGWPIVLAFLRERRI